MARPLRIEFPGALYHVTSRGNERRPIFRSDRDRLAFLDFLGQVARRFGWSITAWVLMTNHFHLVIQTPQPNLSRGMHWLNGTYAGWFNKRHKRWGHLFGGRFKSFLIEKEAYFTLVLRYVVLNPVRAGMVARPEDYRWSSYRATAGLERAPEWLDLEAALGPFAPDPSVARTSYREFVLAKIGSTDRLWDKAIAGFYLGTESWRKRMRGLVGSKPRSTDHPTGQRAVGRPAMHAVLDSVARASGVTASDLRATRGGWLRRLAAWIGWHDGWLTLRRIAAGLRLRSEGHVSTMIRQCDRRFGADRALLELLDSSLTLLRA
ncbi:MAG: transposase [Thermoanaerobaculia bacterium]